MAKESDLSKARARFEKARADNAAELASDYAELIEDLIKETGEARAVDLASRMGVSHVTVSKALQRLMRDGYVTYKPYRSIFLTEQGKALAAASRERHNLVLQFLHWLGVPPDIAEQDAEGLEHHLSEATLAALKKKLHASKVT
ncbi:MAG TPA: manganese-binding transcriptional regulator MntR [Fimbriimonadaceae bacterium]|nr:manganese-binding transcriptional regulator MntR [Fimbriimonadaceae bacterium]